MLLECTFYRTEDLNLKEWNIIIDKMIRDLGELVYEVPKELNTRELDVYCYVNRLLELVEPLDNNPDMCFLGFDKPNTMPSDARVDYFYRPTYIAASFIIKAIITYPEILTGDSIHLIRSPKFVELINERLPKILLGCTGRRFKGHGYDDIAGVLNAMELFMLADTKTFVERYPDLCPEFTKLFNDTYQLLLNALDKGELKGSWGEDYLSKVKKIIK